MRILLLLSALLIADSQAARAENLHLSFSRHPSRDNLANEAFARMPAVDIVDENGNLDRKNSCVIALQLIGGGEATLLGTTEKAARFGRASFRRNALRVSTAAPLGTLRLMAFGRGPGCSTLVGYSDYFSVGVGKVPAIVSLDSAPSEAYLNQVWETQPVVLILNAKGEVAANDNSTVVTISKDDGSPTGLLSEASSVQAVNGVARFADLYIAGDGRYPTGRYFLKIEASGPGYTLNGAGFSLGILPLGLK
ncbi:MAG: hypothetical protein EOP11_05170 [Proteobacteria bacterium]|nr:MAG: hypothetical protein EOP11_05170 [Pseudomonadota bacterium]